MTCPVTVKKNGFQILCGTAGGWFGGGGQTEQEEVGKIEFHNL